MREQYSRFLLRRDSSSLRVRNVGFMGSEACRWPSAAGFSHL
jgi:hypothetical protein